MATDQSLAELMMDIEKVAMTLRALNAEPEEECREYGLAITRLEEAQNWIIRKHYLQLVLEAQRAEEAEFVEVTI